MPSEEAQYKLMRLIEANSELSQRELAREMGVSVGKLHYCLKALTDKGYVKVRNFRQSGNKLRYAYKLTPSGLQEKARVTLRFLRHRIAEYEALKHEIEQLKREASDRPNADS